MKRIRFFKFILLSVAIILSITVQDASSIPAFARKYQISCQVCHSPVMPRLKPFGDDFAGNGFRMTEYESPRYFINTGDDKLSLFRNFLLPSGWMAMLPTISETKDQLTLERLSY
jgi:hypothetical protein